MAERLGRLVIPIGKPGMGEGIREQRAFQIPGERWTEEDAWLRGFLNGPKPERLMPDVPDLTNIMNILKLREKLKQQSPIMQAIQMRKKAGI